MLSGQSILCFAPDPWDDIWRNRHQIMSLLCQENQVLYIEPRPYLRPMCRQVLAGGISLSDLRAPRLISVKPGLQVFRPPLYAPLTGRAPLSRLSDALRAASLRRVMRRLHMDRPIVWLFRPDMSDIPGRYGERLLIYHIVDEYTGYADVSEGSDAEHIEDIRRRERELIAKADLVLVTSQALLESKGGINPNTHWVPNGVDYDRFAAARTLFGEAMQEPEELASLPRPHIGYVGAINDKLDATLLLRIAEAYSGASIVLVGPVRPTSKEMSEGIATLRAQPNVHFVGRVPVERVPCFVAACDVGLLPYRRNVWTRNIHPLKMYEYLACGLPVVATDIPSIYEESDVIHIATDSQSFVEAIGEVLENDSDALILERRERASRNTWRHRVECISELIEATLCRPVGRDLKPSIG